MIQNWEFVPMNKTGRQRQTNSLSENAAGIHGSSGTMGVQKTSYDYLLISMVYGFANQHDSGHFEIALALAEYVADL